MSLEISDETIFYLVVPANTHTGGPKDLHQLGFELKNLGKKVFMYYFPDDIENPIHPNYKIYEIPYSNHIIDDKKNVLIIGETSSNIEISKKYKKIQKVVWWLSLDYFFLSNFNFIFPKILRSIIKLPFNLINLFNRFSNFYFGNLVISKYLRFIYLKFPFINIFKIKNINLNLSQSFYQKNVLKKKKIDSHLLCDFISNEFFEASKKISIKDKKDIICYNPVKSSIFMDRIIKMNSNIEFIPLRGYSTNELIKILSQSKIYMDFGFHPGVDHLPREAAILKNCIITNKEGSAYYQDAVPIDEEFKFEEKRENLKIIKNKVVDIFKNFENNFDCFENYRKKLQEEEKIFKKQVFDIFK